MESHVPCEGEMLGGWDGNVKEIKDMNWRRYELVRVEGVREECEVWKLCLCQRILNLTIFGIEMHESLNQ